MTLILPLLIMGNLEDTIQKKIFTTVKNELTPIVTHIEEYQDTYGELPKNIPKTFITTHTLNNISYTHSSHLFILETNVASIDIDRTRIFYDSRDKKWYQFHNDEYQDYLDKIKRPEGIKNYISFQKKDDLVVSSLKKTNGDWTDTNLTK